MLKDKLVLLGVAAVAAVVGTASVGEVKRSQASAQPSAIVSHVADVQAPAVTTAFHSDNAQAQFQQVSDRRDRYDRDRYRGRSRYSSYDRSYGYRSSDYYRGPRVVERRSTGKSVAIVGGSAAAGAAIGALAGGGKGAAIGAITGGAAGLIYDRTTAKKRIPSDEYYRYRRSR